MITAAGNAFDMGPIMARDGANLIVNEHDLGHDEKENEVIVKALLNEPVANDDLLAAAEEVAEANGKRVGDEVMASPDKAEQADDQEAMRREPLPAPGGEVMINTVVNNVKGMTGRGRKYGHKK